MSVAVITPPAAAPVSLDEAKRHLRVDFIDDDEVIQALINVATATFDGPDSTLGRSLMKQTLAMNLDSFPCSVSNFDVFDRVKWRSDSRGAYNQNNWRDVLSLQQIPLPYPPYLGNVAVTYLDQSGVQQTVDAAIYRVLGQGTSRPRVALLDGQSWPTTQFTEECVSIQWDAGYGDTGDKVPAPIRHAILLTIGHLYENRHNVVVDASRVQAIELPQGAEALVAPYRVFA